MQEWQKRSDIELVVTIDRDREGWQCDVGLVPTVLERMAPSPESTIAITGGPPIMKCGIGICGRCYVGPKYVCGAAPGGGDPRSPSPLHPP